MVTFAKNWLLDLFSQFNDFEACSFGSGSSGNAYYIGNHDAAILIDAGLSSRKIVRGLEEIGKNIRNIQAILISHDHIDHIKGLPDLTQRFNTPFYATARTWEAILGNRLTRHTRPSCFTPLTPLAPFRIGSFEITAFPVSHDAADAIGFNIRTEAGNFGFATDLGFIGKEAAHFLRQSNIMILESNYDDEMLAKGPYPPYLQNRIRSHSGHLSNEQTARFLLECQHPGLTHVFLAHLSEHNNTPEAALKAVEDHFAAAKRQRNFHLSAFDRKKRSKLHQFSLHYGF